MAVFLTEFPRFLFVMHIQQVRAIPTESTDSVIMQYHLLYRKKSRVVEVLFRRPKAGPRTAEGRWERMDL